MRESVTSNSAAELVRVTKIYRRRHLGKLTLTPGVMDLSLAIREGEIFGLLGLNGAGKTTALKLLLGLLFPTRGEVRLFGSSLQNRQVLQNVGYLPELPSFYKYLTITELLELYGQLSHLPKAQLPERIHTLTKEVGLAPHVQKPLRDYSKGMLQRAGLAQALLHDPHLLIFDEPVSGLDPLGLMEMRERIAALNARGKTVLFSTHIITEAEKLCHRVAILHQGSLKRVLERQDWKSAGEGGLEKLFLETIHA